MYQFSTKQKKALENLGQTKSGLDLIAIFEDIKTKVMDVSDISDNYDVQVEARKIVKAFMIDIQHALRPRKAHRANEDDDFE